MRQILFVVPQRSFRDEELFEPNAELARAGVGVVIASQSEGMCSGMRGGETLARVALRDVDCSAYDGVVFVGGNGARELFDDAHAQRIAREMDAAHKVLAAICIAPVILARAGVLRGRRATVSGSEEASLTTAGATYAGPGVCVDGHVVTADGPRSAAEFGAALVRTLTPRAARITSRARRPSVV